MLSTAFQETPVDFVTRTSFDLKRIVEDQVSFLSYLMSEVNQVIKSRHAFRVYFCSLEAATSSLKKN